MHMPFVGREGMAGMAILPPVPWTGAQSMPRGQRIERKTEVQVYDYADVSVPMLARMYKKRLAGYAALGYSVIKELKT